MAMSSRAIGTNLLPIYIELLNIIQPLRPLTEQQNSTLAINWKITNYPQPTYGWSLPFTKEFS